MKQTITIVAFGDSLTEAGHQEPAGRWPAILNGMLQEQFPDCVIEVINAGVGGNTSREGLQRIEADVLRHAPQFVLFEFGNDATFEPERQVGFEEFTANLEQIKTKVAQRNKGRVIPMIFTPIIDEWHQFYQHEFYRKNGGLDVYQEHYRQLTRQFAQQQSLPVVDIDKALRQEIARHGPAEVIMADGCHFTACGNQVLADCIFAVLSAELGKFLSK